MGLLGNSVRLNFGCGHYRGCTNAYYTNGNRQKVSYFRTAMSREGSDTILSQLANPVGSVDQSAFWQPLVGGQMAMRTTGQGNMSATLIPEMLMEVDFAGSGDLTASASLTIAMLCAMTGSGTLSADIVGVLNASVNFTGNGDLSADIKGIGQMMIDLLGSGDLNAAIAGYGDMSIDIVVTGAGLTVQSIAAGVWDELIANHLNPGSTGAALSAAGSAGDPWITPLPGAYAPGTAGAIIGNLLANIPDSVWDELMATHTVPGSAADQLKKTLTTIKFLGLKD